MGNKFSNKYRPSKNEPNQTEPELSEVDSPDVSDRKKKLKKKKSIKQDESSPTHSESFGSTLRRSFRKRNPFRKSKRSSKHKDKNGTAVEEEENGTGMNHPKIIVTSPSDVEASIGGDSPKKQVVVTSQEPSPKEETSADDIDIKVTVDADDTPKSDKAVLENGNLPDNESQDDGALDTEMDDPVSPDTDLETDIANALNFNIGIVNVGCTGTRSDHVILPEDESTVDGKVESLELRSGPDVTVETEDKVIHVEELETKSESPEPVSEPPEVSPGVIANPLLASAPSGSSSSIDQELSLEEISRHEQESQMMKEQEAWEREEQQKKEELQRLRDDGDKVGIEEPTKTYVNGKSASFDEDYPSEGSQLFTPPPKSAPPVSAKPSYKEMANAPSPYSKTRATVESPSLEDQGSPFSPKSQFSDDDRAFESPEKKVELGTGAMADLARQPLSYQELSGVPTRHASPDDKPEPRRRRRSRQASKQAAENKKPLSVDVVPHAADDGSVSPSSPPPVAPRPKNRNPKPPPLPPKAGGPKSPTKSPSQHAEGSISHEQLSFRDRRKYFEQEIKQQSIKKNKDVSPEGSLKRKKISLVSDQDLKSIKQEEEKKYGTLSKDEIRKSMEIVEDDEYEEDELSSPPPVPQKAGSESAEDKTYKVEKKPEKLSARERLNPNFNQSMGAASSEEDLIRSLEQDVKRVSLALDEDEDVPLSPGGSALDERLKVTSTSVTQDHASHDLSPAEKRALDAEKRKQWRQARFKSLEADALQAQMVITKEMMQQKGRRNDSLGGTVA